MGAGWQERQQNPVSHTAVSTRQMPSSLKETPRARPALRDPLYVSRGCVHYDHLWTHFIDEEIEASLMEHRAKAAMPVQLFHWAGDTYWQLLFFSPCQLGKLSLSTS